MNNKYFMIISSLDDIIKSVTIYLLWTNTNCYITNQFSIFKLYCSINTLILYYVPNIITIKKEIN